MIDSILLDWNYDYCWIALICIYDHFVYFVSLFRLKFFSSVKNKMFSFKHLICVELS